MQPGPPTEPVRSRDDRRASCLRTSAAAVRALAITLLLGQAPVIRAVAVTPPSKPSEYDVKAAYLLNFGKFVRMSKAEPGRPSFNICTLGHDPHDPMESSLDALADNTRINGLPVRVAHLHDISAAKSCAIVFISATESSHMREDLAILGTTDILTVSDAPDFLERGGMIQFVLVANHVRFAVNLEPVNRTHLVLSSELLRVASSVSGKPPAGELP